MSKPANNGPLASVAAGFVIGCITAGAAFLLWNHGRQPRRYPTAPVSDSRPVPTASPALNRSASSVLNPTTSSTLDPTVFRVASQFVCICGACGEKPLESCDCHTAVEERGFIEEQLASGRTEAQAAEALHAKYGGLKERNATPPTTTEDQITAQLDQGHAVVGHLATAADRDHIIGHFKCPCEQCSIDELRQGGQGVHGYGHCEAATHRG